MMGRGRSRDKEADSSVKDFHFTVHHDDGMTEITLDADKTESGWNLLGTFYFSQGKASVGLTDETKGRLVYADAVKWIERD